MTPEERAQRSYVRKIKEIILAYEMTQRYLASKARTRSWNGT